MVTNPLRFIWKNKGTVLLAFVLAVAVWISAVIASDPNEEAILQFNPPIEIIGLDDDLVLVGDIPELEEVRLRAPKSVWQEINAEPGTVNANLDLTDLKAGDYELELNIQLEISPYQLVEVKPNTVAVSLEPLVSKGKSIRPILTGEPAFSFQADTPTVTDSRVQISGPESLVDEVDEVRAILEISGARESISSEVLLQPVDANGQFVSGVTMIPDRITITVRIAQAGGYRDLAVRLETVGQPARGYRVTNISVSPPTVTVFSADPQLVADMPGFVSTHLLDLTEVIDDIEIRLTLDLPEGITLVGEEQSVQVQIGIAAIETSQSFTVPIEIVGLGAGLQAEVSPQTVDIFLTGPLIVLENLTPEEDVILFVILTDYVAGTYRVELQYEILPDRVILEAMNPDTIEVIISEQSAPPEDQTPTPEATSLP